jgi:hypothetical protein
MAQVKKIKIPEDAILEGAKALVREQTGGCEFGKVCALCDCNPSEGDAYALDHSKAVLEAAAPLLFADLLEKEAGNLSGSGPDELTYVSAIASLLRTRAILYRKATKEE